MMLNTFLQERFMMANLVKNSNLEIEKSKSIQAKREEAIKDYQTQINVLEGVLNKFRGLKIEGVSVEQASIISNIFTQYDQYREKHIIH